MRRLLSLSPLELLCTLLLMVLILLPLGAVVQHAFFSDANASFFDGVSKLVADESFRRSVATTLSGAAIGTLISLIIGTMLAIVSERLQIPFRSLFRTIAFVPIIISPVGGAIAWVILASPQTGLLWKFTGALGIEYVPNLYSYWGIVFVLGTFYAPYVYLIISNALGGLDASLEEAASTFGARGWARLRTVTLPLMRIPAISACLLVFSFMVAIFSIPTMIGRPGRVTYLSTFTYQSIINFPPNHTQAALISLLMVGILLVIQVARSRIVKGGRGEATVGGKGHRGATRVRPGVIGWIVVVLSLAYMFIAALLPLLALVYAALRDSLFVLDLADLFDATRFSFAAFTSLQEEWIGVIGRTILVGVGTGAAGAVLGIVSVYTAMRAQSNPITRWGSALTIGVTLPVAGIVIGLGYLWVSVQTPFYGSIIYLIAALVAANVAQAYYTLQASYVQIGAELEESAAIYGARPMRRLLSIVGPVLVKPTVYMGLMIFIFAVRELGPILFIFNPSNRIISVEAFDYWSQGRTNLVAMASLLQSTLVLVVVVVVQAFFRNEDRRT